MKLILTILLLNISIMQELQVEGDLTVTGDIHSAVIDSLQNEISILNGLVDSLLVNQTVVESKFVEFNIPTLESPSGEGSEFQYIDLSDLTTDLGEFNRVSLLGIDYNDFLDLFDSFVIECDGGPEICIGSRVVIEEFETRAIPIFMIRGETQVLKYHTTVSYAGFVTLYLLIEKI
jgi:hypothetical protein